MPRAAEVNPGKWKLIHVLYDDGETSVVSGLYSGGERRVLGMRWNGVGPDDLGFPNGSGYPVWHVVPPLLAIPILDALLRQTNEIRAGTANEPSIRRELMQQYRYQISE